MGGRRLLITGCNGQIGSALIEAFSKSNNVIVGADIVTSPKQHHGKSIFLVKTDITYKTNVSRLVEEYRPEWVFHLPAIMSAAAEKTHLTAQRTLRVNVNSFVHMLQLARKHRFRLFCPSTIAAFGPETPKIAPDTTIMTPRFLYGITKVYNELLGDYFARRYDVDFRSLRLPGMISAMPSVGTGTTDYAIDMIKASRSGHYKCYLRPDTMLPMVHIDDCVEGMIKFMSVPRQTLTRSVYNIQSLSFSPHQLQEAIKKYSGHPLTVEYVPDYRQAIADSWPDALDDSFARRDWGWSPKYDLPATIKALLK